MTARPGGGGGVGGCQTKEPSTGGVLIFLECFNSPMAYLLEKANRYTKSMDSVGSSTKGTAGP